MDAGPSTSPARAAAAAAGSPSPDGAIASSSTTLADPPPSYPPSRPGPGTARRLSLCDHEPSDAERDASLPGSAARLFSDPSADPPIFSSRTSDPNPITAFMAQPPSLREPHPPDLLPHSPDDRPTLAEFRSAEGPRLRAAKLRALWDSLPDLPAPSAGPTPTALAQLPGQGTLSPLSNERAERLRRLYQEELVRRVTCERPEAKLWGGPDTESEPDAGSVGASASGSQGETSAAGARRGKGIAWKDFRRFLWDQERELWDIFHELDRDGDGRLDQAELANALQRSGIELTQSTLSDFISFLASGSPASQATASALASSDPARKDKTSITFSEFRDFLIMLPRKASIPEIYKFYQVKKRYPDGRGAARVNMEGDLNVSFPKTVTTATSPPTSPRSASKRPAGDADDDEADGRATRMVDAAHEDDLQDGQVAEDDFDEQDIGGVSVAWKFLLAGGIAGLVSRTATAPFDRLKIYLITATDPPAELKHPLDVAGKSVAETAKQTVRFGQKGFGHLWVAVRQIYADGGGVRAFWVGNGLNVTKIFPESAIKFFSYEYSKRFFAKYWDHVSDQGDISGTSRFISGGIGGITSQLSIYPVETLKTQLQSSKGPVQGPQALLTTARHMWRVGGMRAYYRGLTLGLIGVFPYSAIDMSTFEALKIAYLKSTGADEPPTWAVLSFGAMSGSIGATSVYPINLLRTRLQASGSSGHPQIYTGFWDVTQQTLRREGWMGLYKGLLPTLAKVAPAVSISYVVYEHSKRALHIS